MRQRRGGSPWLSAAMGSPAGWPVPARRRGRCLLRCPADVATILFAGSGSVRTSSRQRGISRNGPSEPVDIGYVTGPDGVPHAFLGIASLGFDSDVQVRANRTRLIRGSSVYTYAALRTLASWRPATLLRQRRRRPGEQLIGWSVAAANSAYYGGGMHYAPSAKIDDGLLELVTAERSSKLHFLRMLPKVFSGRHLDDPRMQVRRARKIQVDADRPFQIYADGDPLADLPATIAVTAGGLRLIGPALPS